MALLELAEAGTDSVILFVKCAAEETRIGRRLHEIGYALRGEDIVRFPPLRFHLLKYGRTGRHASSTATSAI